MSLGVLNPFSQFKSEPYHLQILNGPDYNDYYNYTVHVGVLTC